MLDIEPEKPLKRVSRKRKSKIISVATAEIENARVLVGQANALERAVELLSRPILRRRRIRMENTKAPPTDQELAELAYSYLTADPDEDELVVLMQIVATL